MWYREKYDIIAYEANYNSVKLWVAYSVGPIYCFISQCSRRRTAKFFLPSYIFLSLIFFVSYTLELTERNSTKTCQTFESEWDLKMCAQNSSPKIGGSNHIFSMFFDHFAT